jgi:hypothetical protein
MPSTAVRAPFHEQAERVGSFKAFYDARERDERAQRPVAVTGPSENAD